MIFITSDVKVLATITNSKGEKVTISYRFRTMKRGMFKEEMEREILNSLKEQGITKVKVH